MPLVLRGAVKLGRWGLAPLAMVFANSAALAATADDLCTVDGAPAALAAYPSDSALREKAAAIDAALAAGLPVGPLAPALAVTDSQSVPPSMAALATFCVAAGEAARTSDEGGQFQAHAYLIGAFRQSESAALPQIGALAAFRLGQVHAVEIATAGGRGVGFGIGTGGAPARDWASPCDGLANPDPRRLWGRALSEAALSCAAVRAGTAGDAELVSLSNLRLARLALTTTAPNDTVAQQLKAASARTSVEALAAARAIPASALRAEMIGRLVETALDGGSTDNAGLLSAIGAMREASGNDPGGAAYAAALDGRMALRAGDRPAATQALQRAVFLEAQRAAPWRLPDWLLLLGEADPANRRMHIDAAYRTLETIRPQLPAEDPLTGESTFSLRMRKVYEAAVAERFAGAPEDERATIGNVQSVVETARQFDDPRVIAAAQQVIEAYREAEIQSLFGEECAPPSVPFRPADLRPDELVLYPVVLADRLELIYADGADSDGVGKDGTGRRFHRLAPNRNVTRAQIQELVASMATLGNRRRGEGWQIASRRLYDLLIAPVEGRFSEGKTLIVVPDNVLRALPFAALSDAGDRFLVERTRIAVAPALAYLQPGTGLGAGEPRVVAAALAQEVTLPAGVVFAKLENTVGEARAVAGAKRSRVIENFSKSDLETVLRDGRIDVLHLATHASFNGGSDRSFIVAADELILLSQLRQSIAERRSRGDALTLLVLSACETAVGDDQAAMGLAGAAIQAGAESALASLWQVDDVGTAEMMQVFYAGLRGGESKSQALRSAQRAMIAKGGRVADPWVWAAFTMLGGWR